MSRSIICIDLVPYEYVTTGNGKFSFPNFTAYDLRVPERWQNRQGGEYEIADTTFVRDGEIEEAIGVVTHHDDMTLEMQILNGPETEEEFEEAMTNLLSAHDTAFSEIGWEALRQSL